MEACVGGSPCWRKNSATPPDCRTYLNKYMRIQIALLLPVLSSIMISCRHNHEPDLEPSLEPNPTFFVSGIYASFEESASCKTWDTLIVSKSHSQVNVYNVARHTAFQRHLEDDYYSVETVAATWTASYDPIKEIMLHLTPGQNIVFDARYNQCVLEKHEYEKIE